MLDYKCKTPAIEFTCNVCGVVGQAGCPLGPPANPPPRETPSCTHCGSTVRMRGLIRALSMEVFGLSLALPDFPRVKSLRGLGIGDARQYADRLTARFDYRNTFYTREPRLDITNPPAADLGAYDFIVASEIFEHVAAPAASAFQNAFRLLKPNGILALTVPYSLAEATAEHFPGLGSFGLAQVGDRVLLVNRTISGQFEVHDNLVFHFGSTGPALEMREFSESDLRAGLTAAGFGAVQIYSEDEPRFGVINGESWSLPIVARKGTFAFSREAARELVEQWAALQKDCREWAGSFWVRLGGKLGLIDLKPLLPPAEGE
jgi:SAM-dependent methyltransferase